MHFSKPAITIEAQIKQLQRRGLIITDEQEASHFLSNISYYRLAGYWWALQSDKANHTFKPGSKFETVIHLYNFDREIRLLILDAIERIEISFRTKLIYELSHYYHPYWFEDKSIFKNISFYTTNLQLIDDELKRSKEVFIIEHKKKYTSPSRPPSWKTIEILSLGHLSKLYNNLKDKKIKDKIADCFLMPNSLFLESWLQPISLIRNICAHHSRLWNKNLPIKPKLFTKTVKGNWIQTIPNDTEKLYTSLCCIKYLLEVASPGNSFTLKLKGILQKYSNVDINAMGFTANWHTEDLWG